MGLHSCVPIKCMMRFFPVTQEEMRLLVSDWLATLAIRHILLNEWPLHKKNTGIVDIRHLNA